MGPGPIKSAVTPAALAQTPGASGESRVYRLVWLGRWIERARNVARTLLWAAEHEATTELEEVLGMAADVRGVKVAADESALRSTAASCSSSSTRAPGLRVSAYPCRNSPGTN
jgi:uncharacterized alpha-E superfamily protein